MFFVPPGWTEQAQCLGEDPELFFPISDTGPGLDQVWRAKAVCRECPVMRECLRHAVESGERAGIWGGTTPDERRAYASNTSADSARPARGSAA